MEGEVVNVGGQNPQPTTGTAGVKSQVAGAAATVSNVAGATGGLGSGNFIEPDIDQELFRFKGDDTPLMQAMLWAKKVKVKSPVVKHYMLDEPRSNVVTSEDVAAANKQQALLPLETNDQNIPRPFGTLLVKGVDGYAADGKTVTPGKELMLFVTGQDPTTNHPIVRAINGPKTNVDDEYCNVPAIPAGTVCILLANALYETQKEVDPDLIVPQPTDVYLQKRGMNQIVSDYLEAQRKQIPFSKALIAEAALTKFKVDGNRTLWAGRRGRIKVQTPKVGVQDVYFTEGIRWQFKKEVEHTGKWTIEEIIALAKVIFTGEDVPKSVVALAGKNFLENIQTIDYSKHPEIQISTKTNPVGWTVTNFHTVFGDIEFKHDPTLDRLKWSNSAGIIALDRLVHYQLAAEHKASDRIEGEEATRESLLVWDALALKGSCHVWVNGEGESDSEGTTGFILYDGTEAPENPVEGKVYYLLNDCPSIHATATQGDLWQWKDGKWVEYTGEIMAN